MTAAMTMTMISASISGEVSVRKKPVIALSALSMVCRSRGIKRSGPG